MFIIHQIQFPGITLYFQDNGIIAYDGYPVKPVAQTQICQKFTEDGFAVAFGNINGIIFKLTALGQLFKHPAAGAVFRVTQQILAGDGHDGTVLVQTFQGRVINCQGRDARILKLVEDTAFAEPFPVSNPFQDLVVHHHLYRIVTHFYLIAVVNQPQTAHQAQQYDCY